MIYPENRALIAKIIDEFETIEYSIGRKGTQIWIREYEKYTNQTGLNLEDNHFSWVRSVYNWSQLYAFYKLWFILLFL